jgi:hypothetical protein
MCNKVLGWDYWERKKNTFQDGRKILRDAAEAGGGLQLALEKAAEKERNRRREKRKKAQKNTKKKKKKKDDETAENREKVDIEASTSFERWLNQENLMTRTMIENVALAEKAKEEAEKQRLAEAEALANADSDDDD